MTSSAKFCSLKMQVEVPGISQNKRNSIFATVIDLRSNLKIIAQKFDSAGYNELHWATVCNKIEQVKTILKQQSVEVCSTTQKVHDSWAVTSVWNKTPLAIATEHKFYEMMKVLLEYNASPYSEMYVEKIVIGGYPCHVRAICYTESVVDVAKRNKDHFALTTMNIKPKSIEETKDGCTIL